MAHISLMQPARARLATTKGVYVTDAPLPKRPEVVAFVLAGIRCMHIRREGDAFSASAFLRGDEWLPLADGVPEDAAFAAIASFLSLVQAVPQHYAPEHDVAERAAAAEVFAAFAPSFSIAA